MMKSKYVIIRDRDGNEFPVLFDELLTHVNFDGIKINEGNGMWHRSRIISGGFVTFGVVDGKIKVNVFGKSVSANVPSRPEDAILIGYLLGIP